MQKIRDWNYSNQDMDFVESKRSLPCLMQPTISPCPDSSSHLSPDSTSLISILILSHHLRLGVPEGATSLGLSVKITKRVSVERNNSLLITSILLHVSAFLVEHYEAYIHVHSCQQKSIGLKFSKSQTGSDVRQSCHHNSSRFTFPIFTHSCRFSVLHSLQSITPRIY